LTSKYCSWKTIDLRGKVVATLCKESEEMKQFPRPAQASRKYFYFFFTLVSLVLLMDLAGGVSSRSVDWEAKENKLRESEKTLFVDGPITSHQTATSKASDSPAQQSKSNPVTPSAMTFTSSTSFPGFSGTAWPITVSSLPGAVTKVTVKFTGLSVSNLYDAAFLLVAPGGQKLDLMSDICAVGDITLDDAQGSFLLTTVCSSPSGSGTGSYKPTNPAAGCDTFPGFGMISLSDSAGASSEAAFCGTQTGTGTLANHFNGLSGSGLNGTWNMYAQNQAAPNASGSITSWSITFTTTGAGDTTTTTFSTNTPNPSFTSGTGSTITFTGSVADSANGATTVNNGNVTIHDVTTNTDVVTGAIQSNGTFSLQGTIATEGAHDLYAIYDGGTGFQGSQPSNHLTQTVNNHTTSSNGGFTMCNTGTITIPSGNVSTGTGATPYPSEIILGNGEPSVTGGGIIEKLTVTLNNITFPAVDFLSFMLVSPTGKAFEFMSDVDGGGGASGINLIFDDNAANSLGLTTTPSSGTFKPSDCTNTCNNTPHIFPSPAPASYDFASPRGSATLTQDFAGLGTDGTWKLYVANGALNTTGSLGAGNLGWCLNFTMQIGAHGTQTVVTSSKNPAIATTDTVTITATVTTTDSSGTVNTGAVTFSDGGATLASNVAVVNGVASFMTSSLAEGTHHIVAQFGGTNSGTILGPSSGAIDQRIDHASNISVSGGIYTYCNPGTITLPAPPTAQGPAGPYPSNIFVTNLPGTVKALTVTLKGFNANVPSWVDSLLVGPNGSGGVNTLDFFSGVGGLTHAGTFDLTFDDTAGSGVSGSSLSGGTYKPTSGTKPNVYQPCPNNAPSCQSPAIGPPAPAGPYNYSQPQNPASILGNAGAPGLFGGTTSSTFVGNGTWSLYQVVTQEEASNGSESGWCTNFIENPPAIAITSSHSGSFRQGDTADTYTIHVTDNGPGPTGDPDGLHPVIVTEIPITGLTVTGMSGNGWTCTTLPICKRSDPINSGSSYPDITVTVSVGCNAATGNNTASVQGGGASGTVTSAGDSTTVNAVATNGSGTLTVLPTTALAGASQNFTFTYTTAAGGLNGGEIDITIPAGWSSGSATTDNGSATITGGVIKVTGITTPSTAGSLVTIGYNGATVTTTPGSNTFSTTEESASTGACALTALANSPAVTVTNTDTWTGGTSTDWNTAGNWSPGPAPGTINDVSIPNVGSQPNVITPDVTINSLNVSSGRTLTINSGHILTITGSTSSNLTLGGQISGGELDFGAGTHTISGGGSISSTNTTKVLSGATVSLSSDMQMGNLTINGGGTLNLSSHTLSLSGTPTPLTVSGTFNPAPPPAGDTNLAQSDVPEAVSGTVLFNGGAAQNAPGITYGGLTISNSSGVTLTGDATVNAALTLTSGDLNTGSFTLTMANTATSSGTTDVVGNVKRTGFATAACASAPCANTLSAGNPNNQITITAGTAPTSILVNMAKSAPASYAAAVQRNYTITPTGGSGITATLRLHYLVSELNGNTPESSLNFRRFNGSNWVAVVATQPVDTTNHWVESNAVTSFSQWTFSALAPTAAPATIGGRIANGNGNAVEGAVVRLSGDQSRKTITDANGNYHFDNVETNGFYTVTPSRANFNFNPFNRSFSQLGNETDAVFTAASTGDNANPLDTAEYFVRQQYVDVLGREPDEAGFNYWSDQIMACQGEARCVSATRTSVAAAFFIEPEGQQTGAYIYDVYQGALGRRPGFAEYATDRQQVVGGVDLDAEQTAFAQSFVQRPEFMLKYQTNLTAESFVDALLQNVEQVSGVDLTSQRDSLVSTYNGGANLNQSRGLVVRAMADNSTLSQANYNSAFVLTEYFGYLRRDPDQAGYNFWLNALNAAPNSYRGMVCAFATSTEYQRRFSNVVSHSNSECGQ
jgi:hypothetical protein